MVKRKKRKSKILKKRKYIITIIIVMILFALPIYYFLYFKETSPKKKSNNNNKIMEKKKLTIVDEDSNQRPIAIMLDNNVGNNAHAGLQDSYLNYEIIVEGGLTRIMAIFKDKDVSLIGPVRSSRHYFLDYSLENDSIYTHFGWSPYAEKDIKSLNINNINGLYDDNCFWREKNIASPHNVFTSTEKLYHCAKEKNYSLITDSWKLLNYKTEPVFLNESKKKTVINKETGKKEIQEVYKEGLLVANQITIPYSNYQTRSYTYDQERKVYLRSMNNSPHIDKTTGNQLYYKNIIIENVANQSIDSYGRQDLTTNSTGSGYYITNGYALPITWTKNSRSAKTIYTYQDGSKVKFNDGNTFIQIEPINYKSSIE